MLFPCASYVSPLFLLTKLGEGPLFDYRINGTKAKEQRRYNGGITGL